jgi:DNA-binding CsgD family transcriptional regulator
MHIIKSKMLADLERTAYAFPAPIYWMSTNNVALGANDVMFKAIGAPLDTLGKTPYDYYPYEMADHIVQHNQMVIQTGQSLCQEEVIKDISTGLIKSFNAIKSPLLDDHGDVIGIVGISLDITLQKQQNQDLAKMKIKALVHKFKLTPKELICINHLLLGKTATEMGIALEVSPRTIETHLSHIKDKLYCTSKSQLIAQLIKLGFSPASHLLID